MGTRWYRPPAGPKPPVEVRLRPLVYVAPKALGWLWPMRVPLGKVTLLVGDPGRGKSLLALDMAARVTRGMPWPDSARPAAAAECQMPDAKCQIGGEEQPNPCGRESADAGAGGGSQPLGAGLQVSGSGEELDGSGLPIPGCGAPSPDPGALPLEPDNRNPEPDCLSPEPGTWNPAPKTRRLARGTPSAA